MKVRYSVITVSSGYERSFRIAIMLRPVVYIVGAMRHSAASR